jgi:hypothetical protein
VSPSPPPRGRHAPERRVVVERVIKEASVSVQHPTLTRTNYSEWHLLMKVNMQAQGIWHTVEPEEEEEVEYREDCLTFAAILRAVSLEMLASLSTKRTAQSAWEAIKSRRIGVQRVRDANTEQLRKDFDHVWFKDRESVDDFSMRLTGLTNNIAVLGGKITEAEIVKKMLHVAPEPLEQVAISIETLFDLDRLTVEEVIGHLRNVEQCKKTVVSDRQGRLLLMEEEWRRFREWRRREEDKQIAKAGPRRQADPLLELWQERSFGQGLLEQAQKGEGPCGPNRGRRQLAIPGKRRHRHSIHPQSAGWRYQ